MNDKSYKLFYQSLFYNLNLVSPEFSKLKENLAEKDEAILEYGRWLASSLTDKKVNTNTYGLADIFNNFGTAQTSRTIIQDAVAGTKVHFEDGQVELDKSVREKLLRELYEKLDITTNEANITQALNALQDQCSFLPAPISENKSLDISLYEYVKLSIAFSQTIERYLQETGTECDADKLNAVDALLLVSFDISGIQSFIYKITTKGAYKQLRSRSFYLDMISEWMADTLLDRCGFTRANLIYSGGGHAYLLLPNTSEILNQIKQVEKEFNEFFLNRFGIDLYVAFGAEAFSPSDIKRGNIKEYRHIYRNLSRKLSDKKLQRYSAADIAKLNRAGKRTGRECRVCHSVDNLTDEGLCQLCLQLEHFSNNIQKDDYFVIDQEPLNGLAVSEGHYLHKITRDDVIKKNYTGTLYAKNQFEENHGAIRIMAGDYAASDRNELSFYAERPKGLRKIAALRCDADNLGYAFMAGFSEQDGGVYNTFARSAEFSHNLSMFFKYHINQFANGKKLMVIYSGGDDVFLLGAWDDVLAFAVELREKFREWTNDKLTLSSGIALFDATTPINIVARETGDLEDSAKDNDKDSICVFDERYTYKYDEFINNVYRGKLPIIRNFFDTQDERGNSFIYKLLDLIRERQRGNKITFARLVYYLARLEDLTDRSNDPESKMAFAEFKRHMKDWFDSDSETLAAELALILYVYENRKDS